MLDSYESMPYVQWRDPSKKKKKMPPHFEKYFSDSIQQTMRVPGLYSPADASSFYFSCLCMCVKVLRRVHACVCVCVWTHGLRGRRFCQAHDWVMNVCAARGTRCQLHWLHFSADCVACRRVFVRKRQKLWAWRGCVFKRTHVVRAHMYETCARARACVGFWKRSEIILLSFSSPSSSLILTPPMPSPSHCCLSSQT